MRTLLASALAALGVLSSTALADPIELSDAEMDGVTAAGFVVGFDTFRTDAFTFGRTLVPPVSDPIPDLFGDRFDRLPGGAAVIVVGDDILPLRDRKGIRFVSPALRDLRAAPGTVIVIENKIFVEGGGLPD